MTEQTPLERAARALAKCSGWEDAWEMWLPEARAVLMSVREPSEAMLDASFIPASASCSNFGDEAMLLPSGTTVVWQAMIDSALNEGTR